jgi:hypothetical protein
MGKRSNDIIKIVLRVVAKKDKQESDCSLVAKQQIWKRNVAIFGQ